MEGFMSDRQLHPISNSDSSCNPPNIDSDCNPFPKIKECIVKKLMIQPEGSALNSGRSDPGQVRIDQNNDPKSSVLNAATAMTMAMKMKMKMKMKRMTRKMMMRKKKNLNSNARRLLRKEIQNVRDPVISPSKDFESEFHDTINESKGLRNDYGHGHSSSGGFLGIDYGQSRRELNTNGKNELIEVRWNKIMIIVCLWSWMFRYSWYGSVKK